MLLVKSMVGRRFPSMDKGGGMDLVVMNMTILRIRMSEFENRASMYFASIPYFLDWIKNGCKTLYIMKNLYRGELE